MAQAGRRLLGWGDCEVPSARRWRPRKVFWRTGLWRPPTPAKSATTRRRCWCARSFPPASTPRSAASAWRSTNLVRHPRQMGHFGRRPRRWGRAAFDETLRFFDSSAPLRVSGPPRTRPKIAGGADRSPTKKILLLAGVRQSRRDSLGAARRTRQSRAASPGNLGVRHPASTAASAKMVGAARGGGGAVGAGRPAPANRSNSPARSSTATGSGLRALSSMPHPGRSENSKAA